MKPWLELLKARKDLNNLFDIFTADLRFCTQHLAEAEFWPRIFYFFTFASIEGLTFQMKQVALKAATCFGVVFTPAEISFIKEEAYSLDDNGKIIASTPFIKIKNNLRFAFRIFAKAYKKSYELKVDGKGWESFQKAIKIRNRLVHPKSLDDLIIGSKECEILFEVNNWYSDAFADLASIVEEATTELEKTLIKPS